MKGVRHTTGLNEDELPTPCICEEMKQNSYHEDQRVNKRQRTVATVLVTFLGSLDMPLAASVIVNANHELSVDRHDIRLRTAHPFGYF